jgi:hypothetical protein
VSSEGGLDADASARFARLQRENSAKTATKKTTRHSEKTRFSLGNAFFLQ